MSNCNIYHPTRSFFPLLSHPLPNSQQLTCLANPLTPIETKTLKRLVRDIIDPSRDLGHVDGKKIQKTDADDNDDGNASTEPVAVPFHAGADGREDDEGKMEEKEDSVMVHDAEASLMKEVGRSPGGKTAAEEEEEEEEGKGEREAKRDVKVKDACEDCS